MENIDAIAGIGSVVTAGLGIYQTMDYNKKMMENEEQQHSEEMKLLKEQHDKELVLTKQTYLISTFTEMEEYCQQLNNDLINSSRDAERDMADQRNQQLQTMLVAATIMIIALISGLIQGVLPPGVNQYLIVSYSVTNAASLLCLIMCTILSIELISRVNRFMYKRSHNNIRHLIDAITHTKQTMDQLGIVRNTDYYANKKSFSATPLSRSPIFSNSKTDQFSPRANSTSSKKSQKVFFASDSTKSNYDENNPNITLMTNGQIDSRWLTHEEEIHKCLESRGRINDRISQTTANEGFSGRMSFDQYWNIYCNKNGYILIMLFYLGTIMSLCATMVYMYSYFTFVYLSHGGAYAAVATIGISLVICICLAIYLRYFDPSNVGIINDQNNQRSVLRNYHMNANNSYCNYLLSKLPFYHRNMDHVINIASQKYSEKNTKKSYFNQTYSQLYNDDDEDSKTKNLLSSYC